MKNLNDAMKDMKITNGFEDHYFLMQISQRYGFGGLGEDHNISLAIEIWKINSRWKTPSADRHIAETFTPSERFLNSNRKWWRLQIGELVPKGAETTENTVTRSSATAEDRMIKGSR